MTSVGKKNKDGRGELTSYSTHNPIIPLPATFQTLPVPAANRYNARGMLAAIAHLKHYISHWHNVLYHAWKRLLPLWLVFLFLSAVALPIAAQNDRIELDRSDPIRQIQEAKQYQERGEFDDAIALLKNAASTFERRGDRFNQVIALSNLALIYYEQSNWQEAVEASDRSVDLLGPIADESLSSEQREVLAKALDLRGQIQLATGKSEDALQSWQQSASLYEEIYAERELTEAELQARLAPNQINQAQAMQRLGLYPRACRTLLDALGIDREIDEEDIASHRRCQLLGNEEDAENTSESTEEQNDERQQLAQLDLTPANAIGLRSLGDVLRAVGELEDSEGLLKDTYERATSDGDRAALALGLGNTERALARRAEVRKESDREYLDAARKYYGEAIAISSESEIGLRSRINLFNLDVEQENLSSAQQQWGQLQPRLSNAPTSYNDLSVRLYFVRSYFRFIDKSIDVRFISRADIKQILEDALTYAEEIGSDRARAIVLGSLGRLEEERQNWENAEKLTNEAISLVSGAGVSGTVPALSYQFFWQRGRIQAAQKNSKKDEDALISYQAAFDTLQQVRQNLVSISEESQFNYRDDVEPLYREYTSLLLPADREPETGDLPKARAVIEALQLVELEDFFRDTCATENPELIDDLVDRADTKTAVIYTILLENRLEIIVKLPRQESLKHYRTANLDRSTFRATLEQLRNELAKVGRWREIRRESKKVYSWLIQPIQSLLRAEDIQTLVFILDAPLSNIPMSVLFNGERYLVQDYAIALAPSLQLIAPEPLSRRKKVAIAGLSISPEIAGLAPLRYVQDEINAIEKKVGIDTVVKILNEDLTAKNLRKELNRKEFNILHLATHGQFSSNLNQTFLALYQELLDINELGNLIRTEFPIELLILSACETATGDDRATLGLSGIAARSGARATIASLWNINDKSAAVFMSDFYTNLGDSSIRDKTLAEVLQEVQKFFIERGGDEPHEWAAFILVGNWL